MVNCQGILFGGGYLSTIFLSGNFFCPRRLKEGFSRPRFFLSTNCTKGHELVIFTKGSPMAIGATLEPFRVNSCNSWIKFLVI